MVRISGANAGARNGTRASSMIVTMVAWLTCWYMSMSDQRTGTAATNPVVTCAAPPGLFGSHCPVDRRRRGSTCCPSPAGARHRANLARRHRQCGQVLLTAFMNFAQRSPCPLHSRRAGVLPLGDLLFAGFIRLADREHIETQRAQRRVDVVTNCQARQRVPPVSPRKLGYRGEQTVGTEPVHQ